MLELNKVPCGLRKTASSFAQGFKGPTGAPFRPEMQVVQLDSFKIRKKYQEVARSRNIYLPLPRRILSSIASPGPHMLSAKEDDCLNFQGDGFHRGDAECAENFIFRISEPRVPILLSQGFVGHDPDPLNSRDIDAAVI